MLTTILIIWAIFDIVVYAMMWYDRKDHQYNFKEKLRDIKESFEQDE